MPTTCWALKSPERPSPQSPLPIVGAKSTLLPHLHRRIPILSKEKYVHSNFKFVVNPSANYRQLCLNSDKLVEWDTVELVQSLFEVSRFSVPFPASMSVRSA
jgi:hypothetical protein